jgi:hypothetical protein
MQKRGIVAKINKVNESFYSLEALGFQPTLDASFDEFEFTILLSYVGTTGVASAINCCNHPQSIFEISV